MPPVERRSTLAASEAEFVSGLAAAESDPDADITVLSDVLRRRRELDLRDLPIDMKVELIASR